jgi:hypothetical protein
MLHDAVPSTEFLLSQADPLPAAEGLRSFPASLRIPPGLTVVEGEHPLRPIAPPSIALHTDEPLEILELLSVAGIRYRAPTSAAANLGVAIFRASRAFALESAPEWIGFDWDFTTNYFQVYSPIPSLLLIACLRRPPQAMLQKPIDFFEISRPGMYECIFGMAVGYALRQGLRSFPQWEYYRPQVRWVTQTWPLRLALFGTNAFPLIPLLMGRFPGRAISEDDIRRSDAFITVEDFVSYSKRLLERFQDSRRRFYTLSAREQDEVIEILRAGKGFKLKPMGAFLAKGWSPPELIFDDSPSSTAQFQRDGARVVTMHNVLAPGREMREVEGLCFRGKRAAAQQMVAMASQTEGPALLEVLRRLSAGERSIELRSCHLTPIPEGTVVVLHDGHGAIADMFSKFITMQRDVDRLIKRILRDAGGIPKLEEDYRITSARRRRSAEARAAPRESFASSVIAGWERMTRRVPV